jgi:hypothetical protein
MGSQGLRGEENEQRLFIAMIDGIQKYLKSMVTIYEDAAKAARSKRISVEDMEQYLKTWEHKVEGIIANLHVMRKYAKKYSNVFILDGYSADDLILQLEDFINKNKFPNPKNPSQLSELEGFVDITSGFGLIHRQQ